MGMFKFNGPIRVTANYPCSGLTGNPTPFLMSNNLPNCPTKFSHLEN